MQNLLPAEACVHTWKVPILKRLSMSAHDKPAPMWTYLQDCIHIGLRTRPKRGGIISVTPAAVSCGIVAIPARPRETYGRIFSSSFQIAKLYFVEDATAPKRMHGLVFAR